MDFCQAFLDSLHTNAALTKSISIQDYLPKAIVSESKVPGGLPCVLAYGSVAASYPYYYEISGLNAYCLLISESGSGSLSVDGNTYALTTDTLAFFDCTVRHRIDIRQSQWNYRVFFIAGSSVSSLYRLITDNHGNLHRLSPESAIPSMIHKFYDQLTKNEDATFLHMKFIFDILLEVVLEIKRQEKDTANFPDYLIKIKHNFDTNYQNSFSLDMLEREYHISKYRICREFSQAFDLSPIQYLNYKRIEAVKEALISTDKRINEIGRMVGFENTNHLIRLFKKYTGVTPLNYRKQSPVYTFFH